MVDIAELKKNRIDFYVSVFFSALVTWYYWYILLIVNIPTDIQYHVRYVTNDMCMQGQAVPAHPGFYYIVWFAAGLTCNYDYAIKVAAILIGVFWGATTYVSAYASRYIIADGLDKRFSVNYLYVLASVISCIIYPIPAFKYYFFVGLLPPNVYSNSTWIGGLPFSIIVFALGVHQITTNSKSLKIEMAISVFLIISVLFKPSFAFIFIPTYVLLRSLQIPWRNWYSLLLPLSIALLPTLFLIAGQTMWIMYNPQTLLGGKTQFVFDFPAGWHYTLPNLPAKHIVWRFICSFALPILTYTIKPKWLKSIPHQFALISTAIGFLIFMVVHENGIRARHANFIWQVIYGNHMLYWVIILSVLKWEANTSLDFLKKKLLLLTILIHLVSGIVYLIAIPLSGTYY